MGKKPKKASVNLRVRRLIMKYLTKNRKPFSYDGIIQELIENDIILDIEKEDAINVIEDLYGSGIIVPGIYGENGEINLYFKLNVNDEILTSLKQNGGRKSIDELVEELGRYRAFSEEEVKCGLFELVRFKKIMLDEKEAIIPR